MRLTEGREGKNRILYEELSYKVRGCLFEVYNRLGTGFKETIYHNALAKELRLKNISYESQKQLVIHYKEEKVGFYKPDFIIDNKIILEIKALPEITNVAENQLYNYLKATQYKVGFLVNFGDKLDIKRRVFEEAR